jgi:hypothetical protein
VEVMGLEPTNLLTASQALYQLSYTPVPMQFYSSAKYPSVPETSYFSAGGKFSRSLIKFSTTHHDRVKPKNILSTYDGIRA